MTSGTPRRYPAPTDALWSRFLSLEGSAEDLFAAGRKAAGWAAEALPQLEDGRAARLAVLSLNMLVSSMQKIRREVAKISDLPEKEDERKAILDLVHRLGGITIGVRDVYLKAHRALADGEFGKVALLVFHGADAGSRFFGLTDHWRVLTGKVLDSTRKHRPRMSGGRVPAGVAWEAVRREWEARTKAGKKLGTKEALRIFEDAGGNPNRTLGSFKSEIGRRRRDWRKG